LFPHSGSETIIACALSDIDIIQSMLASVTLLVTER